MKYFSLVALGLAIIVSAKPATHDVSLADAPVVTPDVSDWRRADDPATSDWKYAHGWDGTTLPPIGTVVSSPNTTIGNGGGIHAENIGGVYIDVCIHLGSDWNKKISSFGPDNCNACYTWEDAHCHYNAPGAGGPAQPPVWYFEYPGDATGGLGHDNPWNDRISSFMCTATSCR